MIIGGPNPGPPIMVHPSQRKALYPARKPSWSLTLRRGDSTRSYRIRPVLAGSVAGLFVLLLTAYVGATAYLIYRDDIVGAAVSRQVKMQYAYEERIAALRAELDRLSSRHAVQTEGVEQQLSTLLEQQALIERRQSALDDLVVQARAAGVDVAEGEPRVPRARPDETEDVGGAVEPLGYAPTAPTDADVISRTLLNRRGRRSLDRVERRAADPVARRRVARPHRGQAVGCARCAELSGRERVRPHHPRTDCDRRECRRARRTTRAEPEGGPFIPAAGLHFVERAALLRRTLDGIESLRQSAKAMPLGAPVKALYFSSGFGNRIDPFLKRPAFHAGLDMVAEEGTIVRATAAGTVVSAGWSGGYGEMVEIKHADGVSTRYGHLSEILVSPGMHVDAGTAIGRVGSTGRSTGPHLHYETRRDGRPVDPALYLAAGRALRGGS